METNRNNQKLKYINCGSMQLKDKDGN